MAQRRGATTPVELLEDAVGRIAHVRMSGKLTTEDYERYLEHVEHLEHVKHLEHVEHLIQQHGKLRVLAEIDDYQGLKIGAWWEDTKFGPQHLDDIQRNGACSQGLGAGGHATDGPVGAGAAVEGIHGTARITFSHALSHDDRDGASGPD